MIIFKRIFQYFFFFFLGAFFCAYITFAAISYFGADILLKTNSAKGSEIVNPNIKFLISLASKYVIELDQFEKLQSQTQKETAPPLCQILCNPSNVSKERLKAEKIEYLDTYFRQSPTRAMQDPVFRQRIAEIEIVSFFFPSSLRNLLIQLEQKRMENPSFIETLSLSFEIQQKLSKELLSITQKSAKLKNNLYNIKVYRELHLACEKGTPKASVTSDCQSKIHPD